MTATLYYAADHPNIIRIVQMLEQSPDGLFAEDVAKTMGLSLEYCKSMLCRARLLKLIVRVGRVGLGGFLWAAESCREQGEQHYRIIAEEHASAARARRLIAVAASTRRWANTLDDEFALHVQKVIYVPAASVKAKIMGPNSVFQLAQMSARNEAGA